MSRLQRLGRGARFLVALVVAGVVFGIAAVVQADIPDGGVIHGCYQRNVGNLRVIDATAESCRASEVPLDWNQTGPTGPTGATGPTGPTGARGPSDAWDASTTGVAVPAGSSQTIVSLSLPAGNFFVEAKASISGGAGYQCILDGPGGKLDSSLTVANALATVPVQSTVSLTSAGTVLLRCVSFTNSASVDGHIDAIQIATLH